MTSQSKRISISSIHSRRSASPVSIRFAAAPNAESEEWLRVWESTTAQGAWINLDLALSLSPGPLRTQGRGRRGGLRIKADENIKPPFLVACLLRPTDLIESPVVAVESEIAVEEACDVNIFFSD